MSDLQAVRRGNDVELQFALPAETTDGFAYRSATVRAEVCRAVDAEACLPVAALAGVVLPVAPGTVPTGGTAGGKAGKARGTAGGSGRAGQAVTLHDVLPAALTTGAARLLTYRVQLSNPAGRTAGFGDASYSAAGAAPTAVAGLRAEGSRQGVAVRWNPAPEPGSEVVLRRELVSGTGMEAAHAARRAEPARAKTQRGAARGGGNGGSGNRGGGRAETGVIWLSTTPLADPLGGGAQDPGGQGQGAGAAANGVMDDSAAVGSTYRYAAERQRTVQLGGAAGGNAAGSGAHTVVLHSALSAPVEVALAAVYPPPAPTDLVGSVFPLPAASAGREPDIAVDLIWTPADDPKTVGYRVFRELLTAGGLVDGTRTLLTAEPVRMPAFHDVLPAAIVKGSAGRRGIRYAVTAVDANGLESPPVTTVVEMDGR